MAVLIRYAVVACAGVDEDACYVVAFPRALGGEHVLRLLNIRTVGVCTAARLCLASLVGLRCSIVHVAIVGQMFGNRRVLKYSGLLESEAREETEVLVQPTLVPGRTRVRVSSRRHYVEPAVNWGEVVDEMGRE